jgi:hypothetical protein
MAPPSVTPLGRSSGVTGDGCHHPGHGDAPRTRRRRLGSCRDADGRSRRPEAGAIRRSVRPDWDVRGELPPRSRRVLSSSARRGLPDLPRSVRLQCCMRIRAAAAAWRCALVCGKAACRSPITAPQIVVGSARGWRHSARMLAQYDRACRCERAVLASALIEEKATLCERRGAVAEGYCDH